MTYKPIGEVTEYNLWSPVYGLRWSNWNTDDWYVRTMLRKKLRSGRRYYLVKRKKRILSS